MLGLACSGPEGECKPPSYSIDPRSGWMYAGFVWVYCFLVFVFQDIAKQVTYSILQWKDAAEEEKKATLRMQRENRLKEDEVRPRRDPASSWERAKLRKKERSKSRHMSATSSRSAYSSLSDAAHGTEHVFTNLTASGNVLDADNVPHAEKLKRRRQFAWLRRGKKGGDSGRWSGFKFAGQGSKQWLATKDDVKMDSPEEESYVATEPAHSPSQGSIASRSWSRSSSAACLRASALNEAFSAPN